MTQEERYRVSDLVFSARLVLHILESGEPLTKGDKEVAWLHKTAEAVRAMLAEEDADAA